MNDEHVNVNVNSNTLPIISPSASSTLPNGITRKDVERAVHLLAYRKERAMRMKKALEYVREREGRAR